MNQNYTVLARKYRPTTISELKGQEVLVTTLSNAFANNRIAHAFLLSGVRGVGKTTTARILAKALNCIGEDGKGNITLNPCNKCSNCLSINNDHHLDVLEMDAASKTGIDDIREIIETVKYKPTSARYKVYIIDEVHMLSKSAFNALLKTLEEPPSFVKFIFATTEIKKVPITIISRCQRFDLRRLTPQELEQHLITICDQENIKYTGSALLLIANAAEGSVRDSLSILDQAINSSDSNLTESTITNLLGKGNKEDIYALFTALIANQQQEALHIINKLYNNGVEIITLFEELLETCHLVTMLKTTVPQNLLDKLTTSNNTATTDSIIAEIIQTLPNLYLTTSEANYALTLAQKLSLNGLVVLWQLLTKGIEELKISLLPKKAAEMLVVRITWVNRVATLPTLNKLLNKTGTSLIEDEGSAIIDKTTTNPLQPNLVKEDLKFTKIELNKENIATKSPLTTEQLSSPTSFEETSTKEDTSSKITRNQLTTAPALPEIKTAATKTTKEDTNLNVNTFTENTPLASNTLNFNHDITPPNQPNKEENKSYNQPAIKQATSNNTVADPNVANKDEAINQQHLLKNTISNNSDMELFTPSIAKPTIENSSSGSTPTNLNHSNEENSLPTLEPVITSKTETLATSSNIATPGKTNATNSSHEATMEEILDLFPEAKLINKKD